MPTGPDKFSPPTILTCYRPTNSQMKTPATSLLKLAAFLPIPVAHAIGTLLGWLLYLLPNKKCRITLRNLELCFPDMPQPQRRQLARRSLIETGKGAMEKPILLFCSRKRLLRLVRNSMGHEHLTHAIEAGRAIIICTPHLGDWELIGLYCSTLQPMTNLYRPQRNHEVDEWIRQGRQRLGATLVPTDVNGVRALYRALAKGEMIGILPDQNPGKGTGVFVPFFGISTNTMVLLPRLAHKYRPVVLYSYAERLSWGRGFCLHFVPASKDLASADMNTAATSLNQGLEQEICKLPEQYWWSYQRFRRRPDGEPPLY